ncbi:cytochrome P450 CYP72A219-like [Chenopodium quinoa]|uniref:cytochrome P450 CYP72A219-like n=1 Tax=Chenopodium quinoa TaxID=63459 RepID=UPI000B76B95C|nr:cytochrome P450 CYP72A219-like [Chenopodium quinoa]
METTLNYPIPSLITTIILVIVLIILWKAVNGVWLRPKKMEKLLRRQGFKGNPYKLIVGDVKEIITQTKAALRKPISLEDDHLPRIVCFIHDIIQKHGEQCFAWMGPTPWLIITNAEKIKDVLIKYEDFQKPNHPFTQLLMVGLFGLEGDTWVKHRRIINPAFHMDKLKSMFHLIHESCSLMTTSWEEIISKGGSNSTEIDVWPYLESLTGDIISRVAFGSSYEKGRRICDLQREQVNLSIASPQASNYIPGWRFLPTKKNRRVKEICKEIEESLTEIIDSRKKEMEAGVGTKDDLLGILLESSMREIKENGNEKGKGLTTKEVVDECKIFYLAGSETTSTLIVWALVLMSKHQIWQERARAEVLQLFGKDEIPTFQGLSHLKIVTMILNETLRLYTPAYMLLRKVYKDTKLQDVLVPAGTEILLPLCIIHQDINLWGSDAKEFNPERFAQGISTATKGQPIYYPFSTGPRFCIGQNLSLLEAKLTLAMILQRFSFAVSPTYIHAPHGTLTVRPQHGANLILTKI